MSINRSKYCRPNFDVSNQGRTKRINIDPNIKITPPNLSGTDLVIA